MQDLHDIFGKTIFIYTREHAIADGALVDVSLQARDAGFRIPIAMTAAVWADCVAWSAEDSQRQVSQDEWARLWDVLWMASRAARRAQGAPRIAFDVYRVPRGGQGMRPRPARLHLHIGPGDNAEPVITILMPNED